MKSKMTMTMMTRFRSKRKLIGPCFLFDESGDGSDGGAGSNNGADGSGIDLFGTGNGSDGGSDGGSGKGNGTEFDFSEFKNTYGKDYLDKPYMKELDAPDKVFKTIDNLQTLLGKRATVPDANATEKDWNDYRDRIGIKDSSVYQFDDSHLPENLKGVHVEAFENKVKDLMFKAGLTPGQGKVMQEGFDKLMLDARGDAIADAASKQKAAEVLDADFDAMADKAWGTEREEVQNTAKALLNQFTPADMRPYLEKLPNDALIVMASTLKGVSDKYISNDDLAVLKGGSSAGATADNLRAQAQSEMAKLMSMDPFNKDYATQDQKVKDLYLQIGRLKGDK
jgi:hypothetical protein